MVRGQSRRARPRDPHRRGRQQLGHACRGASDETVIIGGHLDSVPNGGWLDGALGVMAGLEALRMSRGPAARRSRSTLVDWADEEGARFGRSLLGSSAASGSLMLDDVRELADKQGDAAGRRAARERRRARAHARGARAL